MLNQNRFVVYGGTNHHDFDKKVIATLNSKSGLGLEFSHFSHNTHPDGEPASFPEDQAVIKDHHAIICACPLTHRQENQMFDFLKACYQFGAKSVTLVLSFMRYRREDRMEKTHEITRLRWFLRELAVWRVKNLVVCEPHSLPNTRKYCDDFGIRLFVADPTPEVAATLTRFFRENGCLEKPWIYSPDLGSAERALNLAEAMETKVLLTPKKRCPDGKVEMLAASDLSDSLHEQLDQKIILASDSLQEFTGRHLVMREDEVATGGTSKTMARHLRQAGVASLHLVATHPVCTPGWKLVLFPPGEDPPFDSVWFGDTRPRGLASKYEGSTGAKVNTIEVAPTVARALVQSMSTLRD